jgi:hypothetical protein
MEFSGRLAAFPVGDILQWAANDRRTGALIVRRSRREKRVYFREGEVVSCISDDPAEYYGQHLLLHGHLDERALVRALTYCRQHGKRLGVALRELGILKPAAIQETLRRQIEDSVCDLFLWRDGVFYFVAEMPAEEEILPEAIHTVGLVMEGTRWIDEYRRIRSVFIHDDVELCRGPSWPGQSLSPLQGRIAEGLGDGTTLTALYQQVKGSHFRFLEAAFDMAVREIVDIQAVGEGEDSSSRELRLYELLLEQAAEDQILITRQHLAMPIDLLERLFPIWVREPDEPADLPAEAREFRRRFDGRTSLRDLFAKEPVMLARETDLLLRELRAGNLALLPASLADLEAAAGRRDEPAARRWWRKIFASRTS